MLGAAPVAVADRRAGRYEADPAGADGVRGAVDGQLGFVAVEVQLPQVRQPEHVRAAATPCTPTPMATGRGAVEMDESRVRGRRSPSCLGRWVKINQ